MMYVVPEPEQRAGPPAVRPNEPAPIDPEQVRQFQQFQQFQELMRQHGGIPPGLTPPPPRPLWKRVLTSRAVRRLALLLIVVLGLYLAYDYYFGNHDEDKPASETGGGTNKTTQLNGNSPKQTVRLVYQHIAEWSKNPKEQVAFVCGQFDNGAEQQFAEHFQAGSCEQVVGKLNGEIDKSKPGWVNTYAEPFTTAELGEVPTGERAVVSSCDVKSGVQPRLGEFTLQRVRDQNNKDTGQWVIVGHRLETC